MVTASEKPKAAPKKEVKPKAPAKKATASKTAKKPAAKPKKTTAAKTKTAKKTSAPLREARKVGEMVYNDELFESLSEAVLLSESIAETLLPNIKEQLFGYDIYMISFLDDDEIGEIADMVASANGVDAKRLKPLLTDIRDNARVFVDIATKHNSVRSFIDKTLDADGKDRLKVSFVEGQYCLKGAGCESFLLLF
jgi:hypothetical protein